MFTVFVHQTYGHGNYFHSKKNIYHHPGNYHRGMFRQQE